MDNVSTKKRSEIMRAIRNKDSQIENLLRKELRKRKIRFKANVASLTGKPDIVFARKKLAVFIDSCFWHGCKNHCRMPQANRGYWKAKIERNKLRDKEVNATFRKTGWKVLRFWEHQIKKNPQQCVNKIKLTLNKRYGLR
mgnify:CR=1 FL=1